MVVVVVVVMVVEVVLVMEVVLIVVDDVLENEYGLLFEINSVTKMKEIFCKVHLVVVVEVVVEQTMDIDPGCITALSFNLDCPELILGFEELLDKTIGL